MSTSRSHETPASIKPADIYYVLFRHKWKIIVLTLLGWVAAAGFYYSQKPQYESDAELWLRAVIDTSPVAPTAGNNAQIVSTLDQGQATMNSEIVLLTSLDLAKQVATNVGPEKILAKLGGGNDVTTAAGAIRSNLKVEPLRESCVLYLSFRHPDPTMAGPILKDLIQDYQDMHERIRRTTISDEAIQAQASQLHQQIVMTDDEMRSAKTNAGIISVPGAESSYESELARIRTALFETRAKLAEHNVSLRQPTNNAPKLAANSETNVPADDMSHYKYLCAQLKYLDRKQNDYIQQGYTEGSKLIQETRDRQAAITKSKTALEQKFPSLMDSDVSPLLADATGPSDNEAGQVAALTLEMKELQAQYDEVQAAAAKLGEAEAKISDLEQRKKLQEENYNDFIKMQAQASINDALGAERQNIQIVQQPSPAYPNFTKVYKAVGILAMGGLILGLAWAFLIELYLDRSVKRPVDLQGKLRIPFFLSIPDLNHGPRNRLAGKSRRQLAFNGHSNGNGNGSPVGANGNGAMVVASPSVNHALGSHYDALRDRLVNYFESINLTRKPKLVAVTSAGKGAGVSTISAGLAASLSETGDGRVLLVDMNLENGAAQQFIHGQPGCQLDDALATEKRDHALVQENLYVVSEGSNADKLPRILPKRFSSLVPKLRASDYDYIIFDMPPVTQTSVTTRLAGFMDTVMLVVESEKTDRDIVQHANQLLLQSKANVTAVLNKTRNYLPARLQPDIHADI